MLTGDFHGCQAVEFSDDERALLLRGLFGLRVSRAAFDGDREADRIAFAGIQGEEIDELVRRLGGDLDAVFFGTTFDRWSTAP